MSRPGLLAALRTAAGKVGSALGAVAGPAVRAIVSSAHRAPRQKSVGERVFANMQGGWSFGQAPGLWSSNRIEAVFHYKAWVYRCISTLMSLATKEPPVVARVLPRGSRAKHEKAFRYGRPDDAPNYVSPQQIIQALGTNPIENLEHSTRRTRSPCGFAHPKQK